MGKLDNIIGHRAFIVSLRKLYQTFQSQKRIYNHKCLFVSLSVIKTPFILQPSSFILWLLSFTACYINFGIRRFHDSFSSMYLIVGFIKSNWSFIKVCFHFTAIIKLQFHFKIFAKQQQPYKREDKHNTLQKYILIQYELLLGPFDWL